MVTGIRLSTTKDPHVRPASSNPEAAAKVGSKVLMRSPTGMKYMLATECSNPAATKAVMGKMMAAILSTVLRAL